MAVLFIMKRSQKLISDNLKGLLDKEMYKCFDNLWENIEGSKPKGNFKKRQF